MDFEDRFITNTMRDLQWIINNDRRCTYLLGFGWNMTKEKWEDLGRVISNNTHLEKLVMRYSDLNDEKLSSLFSGLSTSSSIIKLELDNNGFSAAGLRSLEPFLQNSINLRELNVSKTNIQTVGFNVLMRALCDSPVESLNCSTCGISSIEIEAVPKKLKLLALDGNDIQAAGFNRLIQSLCDSSIEDLSCKKWSIKPWWYNGGSIDIDVNFWPKNLESLNLVSNNISSDECREIAKLLQKRDTKLQKLCLDNNYIGDDGVAILVDALRTNTTLTFLGVGGHQTGNGISRNGRILILKLLNDMSSIKSMLQSNHTLQTVRLKEMNDDIQLYINMATTCNRDYAVAAGRDKVMQTQLHSKRRAELTQLQGVEHSLYNEIDPLHLPEVLTLVGRRHGRKELYVALRASMAEWMSTVNKSQCIQQHIAYHASIIAKHESVIAEHSAKQRELKEELAFINRG